MNKEKLQHLFVVDRLNQAINDWAIRNQFIPPDLDFLEGMKEDTKFNLEQIFGLPCVISSPYNEDFLHDLKNYGRTTILVDSLSPPEPEINPINRSKSHTRSSEQRVSGRG